MNRKIKRILLSLAALLAAAVLSFFIIGAAFKAGVPEMFMTEEERRAAAVAEVSGGQSMSELTDVPLVPRISELYGAEDGAVVAVVTTEGYEGEVILRIGIGADGTVSGIRAVSHSENPEAGALAMREEYLDTYLGASSADEVDACTGASFTSAAIRDAVERALVQYKLVNGIEVELPEDETEAKTPPADPFADRPVIYITTGA